MNTAIITDSIDIDTTAEQLWQLISEPGWWINTGTYTPHVIDERDGVIYVTDPDYGTFPLVLATSQAPRHIAFRWLLHEDNPNGAGTLIEMWVDDREGGVTLRLRESGFESLGLDEAGLRAHLDERTDGWRTELAIARTWASA